jgi:hypothetical protein
MSEYMPTRVQEEAKPAENQGSWLSRYVSIDWHLTFLDSQKVNNPLSLIVVLYRPIRGNQSHRTVFEPTCR